VGNALEVFATSLRGTPIRADKVSYSYQVFWNACKSLVSGTSPSEKIVLFGGTARRVYRLDSLSLG